MKLTPDSINQVLNNAKNLYTPKQIEAAVAKMADEITNRIADKNPVLLTVMIGGLIPTGMLLKHMSFPLVMDYVHASRYQDKMVGDKLNWIVKPRTELKDRTVLVIDDILDGGITLAQIIDYCKAKGASEVLSAVLVEKEHTRVPEGLQKADFTGVVVPNKFVFGYGMDYKRYLRNAPGIFAVEE